MVLEAVRATGAPPPALTESLVRPPDVLARPDLIWASFQHIDQFGVTTRRTAETDVNSTLCATDIPAAGDRLVASWGRHVFLWTDGNGGAIMLPANSTERIKPLTEEHVVLCNYIPGGITPADVFEHPQNARLIHIGLSSDEAMIREIRERAGVDTVINIQANMVPHPDNSWIWDQFEAVYDRARSTLGIFPVSTDRFLSFDIGNNAAQEHSAPLFIRYGEYFRRGGVIGWSFMRDAYNLPHDEMQKKYPRNKTYLGGPDDYAAHVSQITRKSSIKFTETQYRLYVNLRLIPSEHHQVVYDYGPTQPQRRTNGQNTPLVHPSALGEIGLLGQVLTFTQDTDREHLLQNYLKLQERRHNPSY